MTQNCKAAPELRTNAPKFESGFRLYDLAVHLKQRIDQEIDRPAFRFRVDHQIATFRQLKPIRWVMAKIIIGQLRVFPRFTDIHRNPLIVREKFGPAMVALDLALLLVGWNGRADGETRGYIDASRQCDEVRVEITAIAGVSVARVDRVSTAPTIT